MFFVINVRDMAAGPMPRDARQNVRLDGTSSINLRRHGAIFVAMLCQQTFALYVVALSAPDLCCEMPLTISVKMEHLHQNLDEHEHS